MAVRPQNVISLCSGGGGLDLGLELAVPGARTVCMVEREAFAVARLVAAMRAGLMADCPVWSDVTTFNGRPWRGVVDWVIGGIPCQPHSAAGKRLGREDERDLWADARRIIVQCRPQWVLIENVEGMLSTGGAQRVVNDLERLGFIVEGGLFSAAEVGFTHQRKRVFILAKSASDRREGQRAGRPGRPPHARRPIGSCGGTNLENPARGGGGLHPRSRPAGIGEADSGGAGGAMEHAAGQRCGEGRAEPELRGGRNASAVASRALANPERARSLPAAQPGADSGHEGAGPRDERSARRGGDVAHANGRQPQGRGAERRETFGGRPHDEPARSGDGLPISPPGPGDIEGWRAVLAAAPELEPAVCRVADGLASRVDQLRMLGNGVHPLAAAHAVRTLKARIEARCARAAEPVVRAS